MSDRNRVVLTHNRCQATYPAHHDRPCSEWVTEFEKQGQAVAGGGLVKDRVANGGIVAARSVSDRAAESLKGVHRCVSVARHVELYSTAHMCQCRFEWTDEGAVATPEEDPD